MDVGFSRERKVRVMHQGVTHKQIVVGTVRMKAITRGKD